MADDEQVRTISLSDELPPSPERAHLPSGRGTVKPLDRERCLVCGNKFLFMGNDWGCPAHKTRPSRYQVQLFWRGHGLLRIYSDRQGQVLDSYARAVRVLEVMRAEIEARKFDPDRYVLREQRKFWFKNLAEEWLAMQERRLKALEIAPSHFRHIRMYVTDLLVLHFGARDVREIRKKEVMDFKAAVQDRYSLKSLKNIMSCLHSMLAYWHDLELIEKVPAFPTFRIPEPDWGWLDEETQAKILAQVPDADKPILYFIAYQGVRPSEARALQWRDLDLKGDMVTIRRTFSQSELRCPKGKRMRVLPLDPEVKELLLKLQRPLEPEQFVFLRSGRRYSEGWCRTVWNRICAELGVKGVTFYGGTRHSLASQFVSGGGSILDAKEFLGHQNISTTMRYAHSDLRAKRRVIARRAKVLEFRKEEASN